MQFRGPVLVHKPRFLIGMFELLKIIYSKKATKFCKISTLLLSYVVPVKSKVENSQNCVAFSEYMNFTVSYHQLIFKMTKLCYQKVSDRPSFPIIHETAWPVFIHKESSWEQAPKPLCLNYSIPALLTLHIQFDGSGAWHENVVFSA